MRVCRGLCASFSTEDLPALQKAAGHGTELADLADLANVEPDTLTRWCRAVTGTPEPHPPPPHDPRPTYA